MAQLQTAVPAEEDSVSEESGSESPTQSMKEYRRKLLCQLIGQDVDLTTLNFLTLVHKYSDSDATLSAWGIRLVLTEQGFENFQIDFVNSGQPIDYEHYHEQGFTVIAADVGRGEFDQHDKNMRRGSSFELIVDYFKLWDEPGMKELVELARATDNVEKIAKVSIHYYFKALPRRCRDEESGEIDWLLYFKQAFEFLDGYYQDRCHEATSEGRLERKKDWVMKMLRNGLVIAQLGRDANLRDAAFEKDADCCVFFDTSNVADDVKAQVPDAECAIIQLHRKHSQNPRVKLRRLVAALRFQESKKRGVSIDNLDTTQSQAIPSLGAWHIHSTGNLITCGSRSNQIETVEQLTTLTRHEIYKTVRRIMGDIDTTKPKHKPADKPTSANNKPKKNAMTQALEKAKTEKKEKIKKGKKAPAKNKKKAAAKAKNKKKQ